MRNTMPLQRIRQAYLPVLPLILRDPLVIHLFPEDQQIDSPEKIKPLFPMTSGQPLLKGEKGETTQYSPLRLGVVLSGGQAAGGHNVITGIYDCIKLLHPDSCLFGFLNGPAGIIEGKWEELTTEKLAPYRNQGGFDLIGAGRGKIETEEQLASSLATLEKMQLDGLVIIGGDDSNTNAAILAEYLLKMQSKTKVIGVPKTIDGDLKNAFVPISFGFDTACKTYAEMIGNIARDACSARKYYHFIKLMGRTASHIALECALSTHPNAVIIGEEIAHDKKTLSEIIKEIADLICKRAELGKHYGVILIPEGLIEFIPEMGILIQELNHLLANNSLMDLESISKSLTPSSKECFFSLPQRIQQQLLLKRDPHGNVQVSLIETERLLIELVELEIAQRGEKGQPRFPFSAVSHFMGYEGRAGYPSNFDCNYCYALGFTASLLIAQGATGYMACIKDLVLPAKEWSVGGVPLTALMQIELRKGKEKPVIQKAFVDLDGKVFGELEKQREQWKLQDAYQYPGPIQFFGDPSLTERISYTLALET